VPVEFPVALQWEFILTDVPAAAAATRAQLIADGHPGVIMLSTRFFLMYKYAGTCTATIFPERAEICLSLNYYPSGII